MAIMQPISLVVTAIMIASFAPSISGRQQKAISQAAENPLVRSALLAGCQRKANKCVGQTKEYRTSRQTVKSILINGLRSQGASLSTATRKAEAQLQKLYNLKKKMNAKAGLSRIDPADNGLLVGHTLFTEEQIDAFSKYLDNPIALSATPGAIKNRAAVIYFEQFRGYRWDMPVRYWVAEELANVSAAIDQALDTIAQATGCIKFEKESKRRESGSQMQFIPIEEQQCDGFAHLGHVGPKVNYVLLGINGDNCKGQRLIGAIMHQVIRGLGGGDEQSRRDREDHVEILWDNIDSQNYYNFEIYGFSTSYGVPYTYDSIMHDAENAHAIEPSRPTMKAKGKTNVKFGSDVLHPNDILQLKRIYCTKADCIDKYQDCGYWALKKFCTEGKYTAEMKTDCAKSCGFCGF